MGLFDKLFGGNRSSSSMSDSELTRKLKSDMKFGESLADRANAIREAEKRGLDWKESDLKYKKK